MGGAFESINLFPERIRYGYGNPFPTEEMRCVDRRFALRIRRKKEVEGLSLNRWGD